jgi:hypothetical protein
MVKKLLKIIVGLKMVNTKKIITKNIHPIPRR